MKFLTAAQAAKSLRISRSRVYRLIGDGRLRAERFGTSWLIDPRSLAAVRNRKPGRPRKSKPKA